MQKRTIVIRANRCVWRPKTKSKIKFSAEKVIAPKSGFANPFLTVLLFGAVAGFFYLYSINQSAIKGLAIRQLEKEISEIRKDNEKLKIQEANLKSFNQLEQVSKDMGMEDQQDLKYIDENEQVALGSATKKR